MKKTKLISILLLAVVMAGFMCACGAKAATYTIEVSGSITAPGVLRFLDYAVNVYASQSENPCGDCPDQPVHLYVGASAEETAQAIAEVIRRADDIWSVASCEGCSVTLTEKEAGSVTDIPALTAPEGVELEGTLLKNGVSVRSESGGQTAAAAVELPEDPQRLAAVYGPSYEALVVLGVEDRIVVRADVQTDNFPWAEKVFSRISDTPQLDNVHTAVSFEELMKYSPDLVFTFPRQNETEQLNKAGVATVIGESYVTLEDTCSQLQRYAAALGKDAAARAQAYCSYFHEKLDYIQSCLPDIPENERPKVYYAGTDVLTTYGKLSDMVEVIRAAGGRAVMEELNAGSRSQINYEQLAAWDPDYIFLDHGGINDGVTVEKMRDELLTSKNYSMISAVEESRVYAVPSGVFYWDMGLQKILLVEYMAKTLYPQAFEDLDMEQELMDFYSMFYGYELTRAEAGAILQRRAD